MVGSIHRSTNSAGVWTLAEAQHGVVSRAQLLELGFHPRSIEHRVSRGRLNPVMRGVYAVGRRQLTRRGEWMAAVLGCGPDALLSHSSAAALWGFGAESPHQTELTIRRDSARRRPGLRVRRSVQMRDDDVTTHDGIPVTDPVRTLIDLSSLLDSTRLERCVNEADRLDLTDP